MRKIYLGDRLTALRNDPTPPPPPPDGRAMIFPEVRILDPNSEPMRVAVRIPAYGPESLPLLEVHLFAFVEGAEVPIAPEQWTSSPPADAIHVVFDARGKQASETELGIPSVPYGLTVLQVVLVAGDEE